MPHDTPPSQPTEDDLARVWHILERCRKLERYVAGRRFEEYAADEMLRDAVERNLEVIGEAVGKLSPAFLDAHPEIPWRLIRHQRNIIAHVYDQLADERIWEAATVHAPPLREFVERVIAEHTEDPN